MLELVPEDDGFVGLQVTVLLLDSIWMVNWALFRLFFAKSFLAPMLKWHASGAVSLKLR